MYTMFGLYYDDVGRDCSQCNTYKRWDEYHKRKGGINGHRAICRECRGNKKKVEYKVTVVGRECSKCGKFKTWDEYSNGGHGTTKSQCKACDRSYQLFRSYGITLEQYNDMLTDQGCVCAICKSVETINAPNGKIKPLSVDHCHKTGKIRGLLCSRCNNSIGFTNDDVSIINNAIHYLENPPFNIKKLSTEKDHYNAENFLPQKRYDLWRNYGITVEQYNNVEKIQLGVCAICKQKETTKDPFGKISPLSVDHNHETGNARGLLCTNCNSVLGFVEEDVSILKSAISYLEKHNKKASLV